MQKIISAVVAATLIASCSATEQPAPTEMKLSPAVNVSTEKVSVPGWKLAYEENFERFAQPAPRWSLDTYPNDGIFADNGAFFMGLGVVPPVAFRARAAFGTAGWLTVESYSRSSATPFSSLFRVVADPDHPENKVLRVSSPQHTDATVIRPTVALPGRYRICLNVGYANFGSGVSSATNLNGYLGGERSGPWTNNDATQENGFYWLSILDAEPKPHNNVWIHHHRKVVIDSDNNKLAWTQIWNGQNFIASGEHPVMMFGLDKNGIEDDYIGMPFISYSNGVLQPSGAVRAVDAYKDKTWYHACIERNETQFVLTVSGDFKFGRRKTYTAAINLDRVEKGLVMPDYFMFGDPHNNYYRGEVYYDDVRLEVWR